MSNAITETDAIPAPPLPGAADQIEDELLRLPAPPRVRTRILGGLLTAISVASLFLAWQLRDDVRFAFVSSAPVELGDGRQAQVGHIGPNRVVRLRAAPQMAGAVQYSRPFYPGQYVVFPIAGRAAAPNETLYVQTDAGSASPGEFTGRLVRFSGAGGRYARVGNYLSRELGAPVDANSWLLVSDAMPRSSVWAPVLAAFLLALALSDLALLARLLRPIKR